MIFVVSAPRSGLNWLRFCMEHYLGVKTPGKDVLITADAGLEPVFRRAHNARKGAKPDKSKPLLDQTRPEDKVLILLRDPLESFVRAAERSYKEYRGFIENIRYFSDCAAGQKHAAYYEDMTAKPAVMLETMTFLDVAPLPGHTLPNLEQLTAEWAKLGDMSRGSYEVRQAHGGGSMTKDRPTDFQFHQQKLSEAEKQQVWRHLRRELDDEQMALLARYMPQGGIRKVGPVTRIGDMIRAFS